MDLEIVGRHALLFDDDAMAAFVNSKDALVEWNSLSIDRYDVRHLLSAPPLPRRRRNPLPPHSSSSSSQLSSLDSELDQERYLDLPPQSEEKPDSNEGGANIVDAGSFSAVAFSYENIDFSSEKKSSDIELESSGFRPPFPVPENLLKGLFSDARSRDGVLVTKGCHSQPPTEKVHQIIARTAFFVRNNGGQSEIILRVKQGDNPTFGFLMPDHHLHAYYRFLVDHQELLLTDVNGKSQNEQKSDHDSNTKGGSEGGALSLLGAVYGYEEDDEGAAEVALKPKENVSGETANVASSVVSNIKERSAYNLGKSSKDLIAGKLLPSEEKNSASRKASAIRISKARKKRKDDTSSLFSDKPQDASLAMKPKVDDLVAEPPSDIKRLIDKIVEYILKNGKQFEATLVEQDSKHGRFSFLLPSNQYHSYYLRVLQKAQESKATGKSIVFGKTDSIGHVTAGKEIDNVSMGSFGCDIPYDSDRKEKFKMVIGKSKKDGQDPPTKPTQQQIGVTVDAAAAILQAATRGFKNPNLGFLSTTSLNGSGHGHSSEGGQVSSGLHLSQSLAVVQKSNQNAEHSVSVPVAKALAKTAALEAASEADSSEAHLTKEEKLKAERLKRAKMFVAMLKNGATNFKSKPSGSGGLSEERKTSGIFGSGTEVELVTKEREGSSAPLHIDGVDKTVMLDREHSGDECCELKSRRKYRSRRYEETDEDEEKESKHSRKKHRSNDKSEEKDERTRTDKHSRKKHRSHHSSHDEKKERKDEDRKKHHRHSKKKHRSHSSHEDSDDIIEEKRDGEHSRRSKEEAGERDAKHSKRKHRSHYSSRHVSEHHKHKKSHSVKGQEALEHKHGSSLESKSQSGKGSISKRDDLEEGEISSKVSNHSKGSMGGTGLSREASVDLSTSFGEQRAPSQPSETVEVSDDLRAKIRAMLMGTL